MRKPGRGLLLQPSTSTSSSLFGFPQAVAGLEPGKPAVAAAPPFVTTERPTVSPVPQKDTVYATPHVDIEEQDERDGGAPDEASVDYSKSPVGSPRVWGPPPAIPSQGKDLSTDAALGEYAERSHALLEILQDLHSTGIQNELDLPKIVVVGSQSVGKSSLIESIAGIALPRNSGTCTRCPMECRLQKAASWSLQVILRFQYDSSGKALTEMREIPFGDVIIDKDDVTDRLERAQLAILHPTMSPNSFLTGEHRQTSESLTFSANCVCVRVAGPNIPDLYFYDLPGVIANVSDGGKEADIELVDKLAMSNVLRPNCLVLLVIACDTDFENQKAGRLVLKSKDKSLKDRTVGVLTKVDRIQPGDEERWIRILRKEEIALKNGWYCVKQRGPKELEAGISWEEAKTLEQTFFSTTTPWCDLGDSLLGRVGSEALSLRLGEILSTLVSKELPTIQSQVLQQLSETKAKLTKLAPLDVKQPQTEVIRLLQEFNRALSKHIDGIPPEIPESEVITEAGENGAPSGLMNDVNKVYQRFRKRIKATAPQFKPWSSKRSAKEGEVDPMAGVKIDDDPLSASSGRVFYLDQVMDMAQQARTRELPGNYPFAVKEAFISRCTKQWNDIAAECFQEIWNTLIVHANRLIDEHFGRYALGGLKRDVQSIITKHMQELAHPAIKRIQELVNTEKTPYTQNDHYFFDYRAKLLLRYKAGHRKSKAQNSVIQSLQDHDVGRKPQISGAETQWQEINQALASLSKIGIPGVVATDLIKLLPDDNMGPAFEIMAEVRAYFQVAYKRFSDNIPKQIDNDFVRGITQKLDVVLLSRMVANLNEARCREYLEEPAEVLEKRKELEARIKRLQAARDRLIEFNRDHEEFPLSFDF